MKPVRGSQTEFFYQLLYCNHCRVNWNAIRSWQLGCLFRFATANSTLSNAYSGWRLPIPHSRMLIPARDCQFHALDFQFHALECLFRLAIANSTLSISNSTLSNAYSGSRLPIPCSRRRAEHVAYDSRCAIVAGQREKGGSTTFTSRAPLRTP